MDYEAGDVDELGARFSGDKQTYAQAIRNEFMCGSDGDLSDWGMSWNTSWKPVILQEVSPDKKGIEEMIARMLIEKKEDNRHREPDRFEFLCGLYNRWRSDNEAGNEAIDTISAEVFDDVARSIVEISKECPVSGFLGAVDEWEVTRLKIAISHGLNIHEKDEDGATLLHHCRKAESVKLLMDNGLVPMKDNDGKYPSEICAAFDRERGVTALLRNFEQEQILRERAIEQEQSLRDRAGIGRGRQRDHEMSL